MDRMAEIAKQDVKDTTQEALLKRYCDLLKHTLTNQLDRDFDLPVYLTRAKTIFELQNVPYDLRATLLLPHLNAKAKALIFRSSVNQLRTYYCLKTALLREFRLTPHQYRL